MREFENVNTTLQEGVLIVTINREQKLNALNLATIEELRQVVQSVQQTPEIRGAIITGSGTKAFVAGADISEISSLNEQDALKFTENGQHVFHLIENGDKPIIAAINGFALGGGCELAMACHLRVAMASAKFGQPEVNLGIIPGYGGTQRMTQLVGKTRAFELMMTGDLISAQQALDYGLVNYLVDTPEQLMEKCREILSKIMGKAPLAIGEIIKCINAATDPQKNGYQTEAESFSYCCGTEDFIEGTSAFMEKRSPRFQGK